MHRGFARAAREFRSAPLTTVAVIASMALGIAATTAVLSVGEAVLWRPLPYPESERLVVATAELRNRNTRDLPLSGPDFLDLRAQTATTLDGWTAVLTTRTLLADSDGTLAQARIAVASPSVFRVLEKPILLGRDFADADGTPLAPDATLSTPAVQRPSSAAILSHEYWLRRYGGKSDVLGQRLSTAAGPGALIVGVLAPGVELVLPPQLAVERRPDVWVSARIPYDTRQRAAFAYRVIGRLRPGVSLEQARADVDSVASGLRRAFPLWQTSDFHLALEPLHRYVTAQIAPGLRLLIGAAICLLLIACANVANLLLVQAASRQRELAVRSALGASRTRLIQDMLLQALLLTAVATALGGTGAWIGLRALLAIAPGNLPRIDGATFNTVSAACTIFLGVMT